MRNELDYQRINTADHRDGMLVVLFEDGFRATVEVTQLIPDGVGARWDALVVAQYEIGVPTPQGEVEIPWSTIRVLTDARYAEHLAAAADEQARHVGRRIRALREQRGLKSKDVAQRAGITPQSLSRIEHGRHDIVFTTLQRILAAMGYSLRDLATDVSHELPTEPLQV